VARVLNASGQSWTAERLRRTTKRLVKEGLAEKSDCVRQVLQSGAAGQAG
jgi:hypothetical protein